MWCVCPIFLLTEHTNFTPKKKIKNVLCAWTRFEICSYLSIWRRCGSFLLRAQIKQFRSNKTSTFLLSSIHRFELFSKLLSSCTVFGCSTCCCCNCGFYSWNLYNISVKRISLKKNNRRISFNTIVPWNSILCFVWKCFVEGATFLWLFIYGMREWNRTILAKIIFYIKWKWDEK